MARRSSRASAAAASLSGADASSSGRGASKKRVLAAAAQEVDCESDDGGDWQFNTKPLRFSDGAVLTRGAPEADALSVPDSVREACEQKRVAAAFPATACQLPAQCLAAAPARSAPLVRGEASSRNDRLQAAERVASDSHLSRSALHRSPCVQDPSACAGAADGRYDAVSATAISPPRHCHVTVTSLTADTMRSVLLAAAALAAPPPTAHHPHPTLIQPSPTALHPSHSSNPHPTLAHRPPPTTLIQPSSNPHPPPTAHHPHPTLIQPSPTAHHPPLPPHARRALAETVWDGWRFPL